MGPDDRLTTAQGWAPLVSRSASLPFDPDLDAPRRVRAFVSDTVRSWGFGDLVDAAALLVSEVVTNVVLHARTQGVATVEALPSGVRVEVRDADPTLPQPQNPAASVPEGRGLEIVAALARRWGTSSDGAETKTVWFELDDSSGV
jgi:anti-sigma regulatory factor (Ser/Thr protein kinase)